MCKKRFAIVIPVEYPGDFQLGGSFWRAVTTVEATDPVKALQEYSTMLRPRDVAAWDYCMATDYPPALDVLDARFERPQS